MPGSSILRKRGEEVFVVALCGLIGSRDSRFDILGGQDRQSCRQPCRPAEQEPFSHELPARRQPPDLQYESLNDGGLRNGAICNRAWPPAPALLESEDVPASK